MKLRLVTLVLFGMLGCGKSDNGGKPASGSATSTSGSATAPKSTPSAAIDVAAVNALVPPELKDKFVFEERTLELEDGRGKRAFKVAVPKGWALDPDFGVVTPSPSWGDATELKITSSCTEESGPCKPLDWAAEAEKTEFAQIASWTVIKDEKQATRRSVLAEKNDAYYTTVWWTPNADRYYSCEAAVTLEHKAVLAAFEKACSMVQVPQ